MTKRSAFIDLTAVAGYIAILWGFHLWYEPLGWIVGGVLALAFSLWARQPDSTESR